MSNRESILALEDKPTRLVSSSHLRAEIFCGGTIPARDGRNVRQVTDEMFNTWLMGISFQGFTVAQATGHWRDADASKWSGVERTRVIIVYGPATKAFFAEVKNVAKNYALTFYQDAVAYGFAPAAFHLTSD